jgi:hypothetical protein
MNICVISGEIQNNAMVRGQKTKALVFTVATKQSVNGEAEGDALVSHVPCVIFNPTAETEQLLTTEGKGLKVEFQGRVNASRYDAREEPRSNADVVIYSKTMKTWR